MRIKSIFAGIAAAGVLTFTGAAAFADEGEVKLAAADEKAVLISGSAAEATVDDVVAKCHELFDGMLAEQGTSLDEGLKELKAAITEAGGVDAVMAEFKTQFTPEMLEEAVAAGIAEAKESGATEEELAEAQAVFDMFTYETIEQIFTQVLTAAATAENFDGYIASLCEGADGATLGVVSAALDEVAVQMDAIMEAASQIASDNTASASGENQAPGAAEGGDNADTGVEGVAAVFGVIAIAGAAVVISRKRA